MTGTVAEGLVLAVAPSTGRFRPAALEPGAHVAPGEVIAHVTGGRGRADEVSCPASAVVRRLLVQPGRLVLRGQPLVWLEQPVPGTAVRDERLPEAAA